MLAGSGDHEGLGADGGRVSNQVELGQALDQPTAHHPHHHFTITGPTTPPPPAWCSHSHPNVHHTTVTITCRSPSSVSQLRYQNHACDGGMRYGMVIWCLPSVFTVFKASLYDFYVLHCSLRVPSFLPFLYFLSFAPNVFIIVAAFSLSSLLRILLSFLSL